MKKIPYTLIQNTSRCCLTLIGLISLVMLCFSIDIPLTGELARGKEYRVVVANDGQKVLIQPNVGGKTAIIEPVPFKHGTGDLPKSEQNSRPDPEFFKPMAAVVCDADGDGKEEVYIGWGNSDYAYKAATPQVYRYDPISEGVWNSSLVWESDATTRPSITSMSFGDADGDRCSEIVISAYRSKFVSGGYMISYKDKQAKIIELHDSHMGTHRLIADLDGDNFGEVYVSKIYAAPIQDPNPAWPEDVFLYQDPIQNGGKGQFIEESPLAKRLPTVNGNYGIFIKADIDNDKREELYIADGWHSDYGRKARARLTQIRLDQNGQFVSKLIEEADAPILASLTEGFLLDVTGDDRPELIAATPWSKEEARSGLQYYAYQLSDNEWKVAKIPTDADLDIVNWSSLKWSEPREPMGDSPESPEEMIGQAPPQLKVDEWFNSSKINGLNDLKGKVVILDFWATWCGPCINEMPHMIAIRNKYQDQGLEIIGFTENGQIQTTDQVRAFLKEKPLPYPVAVALAKDASRNMGVRALPTVFLIDRKGIIRYSFQGANKSNQIEEAIKNLLNE